MKYLFSNKTKIDQHKIATILLDNKVETNDNFEYLIISDKQYRSLPKDLIETLELPDSIYESDDWSIISKISGCLVTQEIQEHFLNILPPLVFTSTYLQVSEAVDFVGGKPTYQTFKKTEYPNVWRYVGACWRNSSTLPVVDSKLEKSIQTRREESHNAVKASEKLLSNKLKTILDIPCEIVIRGVGEGNKPDIKFTVIVKQDFVNFLKKIVDSNSNLIYDGPFVKDEFTDEYYYYLIFRTSL